MELLTKIAEIVRQAGETVIAAKDVSTCTTQKTSAADLVTAYDVKVEAFLKEELLKLVPDATFLGEEEIEKTGLGSGWAFIVDPIDGTSNFVRSFCHSAVSVGLAKNGQMEYAVILDPFKKELFTAKRGAGAYLNGQPIQVSERPLEQGIFGMGTAPYNKELHAQTLSLTQQLFERSCDFRRMGAAALDLCAVACGRLEVFFECVLSPWDYAAGSLLVTEAGGCISTLEGEPLTLDKPCSVWACNAVNQPILKELKL